MRHHHAPLKNLCPLRLPPPLCATITPPQKSAPPPGAFLRSPQKKVDQPLFCLLHVGNSVNDFHSRTCLHSVPPHIAPSRIFNIALPHTVVLNIYYCPAAYYRFEYLIVAPPCPAVKQVLENLLLYYFWALFSAFV